MTENFRTYSPLEFDLLDEKQSPVIYVEGGEIAHRLTLSIWNRDEKGQSIVLNKLNKDARTAKTRLKNIAEFADLLTLRMSDRAATMQALSESSRDKIQAAFKGLPRNPDATTVYRRELQEFFHQNHHFEVRFPPGLLSLKTLAWAESQLIHLLSRDASKDLDAWYLCCMEDPADQSGVLYLLSAAEQPDLDPQDSASLGPDLRIILPHLAALPGSDGQVVPVEIRPGPLTRRKDDLADLGPRIRLIEVKSQLGKRFIPLHFAVVGADQLINDDETETFLLLRLTNIDREETITIDRTGNLQTIFSLSCELTKSKVEHNGALSDKPAKVKLWVNKAQTSVTTPPDPDNPKDWPDDPLTAHSDGIRMTWKFDGHHTATDCLAPDESIYMRLAVTTGLRTGPSDLVLTYCHIPNYWDGSRNCKVTKSPLIYDWMSSTKENRVGIGVAHPAHKLEVKGRIKGILHGEDLIDQTVNLAKLSTAVQDALCPVGTILSYAGDDEPVGWELCNGKKLYLENETKVADPQYQNLFKVIGKNFGSGYDKKERKSYFNLPDLRGLFLRGMDSGTYKDEYFARDPDRLHRKPSLPGGAKGKAVGSIQDDAFRKHSHPPETTNFVSGVGYDLVKDYRKPDSKSYSVLNKVGGSETRPKNMYVNFIIKY